MSGPAAGCACSPNVHLWRAFALCSGCIRWSGADKLSHVSSASLFRAQATCYSRQICDLAITLTFCLVQLDNMLLHNAGQSEMLKLCDFGYSKDDGLGTEASGCKTACGTPEYMAPEVSWSPRTLAALAQYDTLGVVLILLPSC